MSLAMDNFQNNKDLIDLGRKEVLVIFSSVTNADPGDIFQTFQRLAEMNV